MTMTALLCCSLLLLLTGSPVTANADADLVDGTALPGWHKETPSRWHSGYLNVTGTQKRLHYVLVESESVDPQTAPVIVWLNGGPGCSSLEGFFYEHGPLVVADAHAPPNSNFDGGNSSNAQHLHELVPNEWSWNKLANVIYLEAPAGVGFSYSPDPNDLTTGDNQTAADSLAALEVLHEQKFPHWKPNPMYISGESYGGVYVPTLALKIYQSGRFPQMAGLLVGNGVFDHDDAAETMIPFACGHGFVSTPSYKAIMKACADGFVNPTSECQTLVEDVMTNNFVDVNSYDACRTCYHPPTTTATTTTTTTTTTNINNADTDASLSNFQAWRMGPSKDQSESFHAWMQQVHTAATRRRATNHHAVVPCINSVLGTKFLNQAAVQTALHAHHHDKEWQICGGVDYQPDGVFPSMMAVYRDMLLANYNPRILIYNGDVDGVCNYLWAEASVAKFGPALQEDWRPWVCGTQPPNHVGEQLGGFVTTYERNISFVTIHGAGHVSPNGDPKRRLPCSSPFWTKPLPTASVA